MATEKTTLVQGIRDLKEGQVLVRVIEKDNKLETSQPFMIWYRHMKEPIFWAGDGWGDWFLFDNSAEGLNKSYGKIMDLDPAEEGV